MSFNKVNKNNAKIILNILYFIASFRKIYIYMHHIQLFFNKDYKVGRQIEARDAVYMQ